MLTKTLKEILSSSDLKTQLRIARQFIPSKKELRRVEGFSDDPMCEKSISGGHANEYVHKYPDKILVISSNKCPVLCRFCTRKRITYCNSGEASKFFSTASSDLCSGSINFENCIAYIEGREEIREVIFSGGDPFMLSNQKIRLLLDIFLKIPQIKKVRFHSRAPTVLPERFDDELFSIFSEALKKNPGKEAALVIHVNHSAEITQSAAAVVRKFLESGISVLSQSVLLKNVNDRVFTLQELFEKLARVGIKPYYLHQLDRVNGSSHFEVGINLGMELIKNLRKTLPRCLIPLYVADGSDGKKRII